MTYEAYIKTKFSMSSLQKRIKENLIQSQSNQSVRLQYSSIKFVFFSIMILATPTAFLFVRSKLLT